MGKKNKKKNQVVAGEPVVENAEQNNNVEEVVEEKQEVSVKGQKEEPKKESNKKKKSKKDKKPSKAVKMFKETGSELKKVTWPTFKETVKRTGVVLGVVIFFGLILFAFDYILTVLSSLLSNQGVTEVQKWLSVGLASAIVLIVVVGLVVWAVKKKNKNRR
ncbi:MAG: preprotein translocase subunit SecE [Firmicutes bacterium]|nr:preprotein translocase subunit SecE [Bacillota bacterium]